MFPIFAWKWRTETFSGAGRVWTGPTFVMTLPVRGSHYRGEEIKWAHKSKSGECVKWLVTDGLLHVLLNSLEGSSSGNKRSENKQEKKYRNGSTFWRKIFRRECAAWLVFIQTFQTASVNMMDVNRWTLEEVVTERVSSSSSGSTLILSCELKLLPPPSLADHHWSVELVQTVEPLQEPHCLV